MSQRTGRTGGTGGVSARRKTSKPLAFQNGGHKTAQGAVFEGNAMYIAKNIPSQKERKRVFQPSFFTGFCRKKLREVYLKVYFWTVFCCKPLRVTPLNHLNITRNISIFRPSKKNSTNNNHSTIYITFLTNSHPPWILHK